MSWYSARSTLLAEHRRYVWGRENGMWIELQTHIGKLRAALRAANVPTDLVRQLDAALLRFFRSTEDSGDAELGWYVEGDADVKLTEVVDEITDLLERNRRRFWRR